MAGIVAALEAHDDIGPAGQPVHHLALALVAPLRADDCDIGHYACSSSAAASLPRNSWVQRKAVALSAAESAATVA